MNKMVSQSPTKLKFFSIKTATLLSFMNVSFWIDNFNVHIENMHLANRYYKTMKTNVAIYLG